MKLFVNSIPVRIQKLSKGIDIHEYDVIVNGGNKNIYVGMLLGDVLINDASIAQIDRMFKLMRRKRLQKLGSITFTVNDRKSARHFVKSRFNIVRAGGGIVNKEGMLLMIYRLNRWDLPKGKLDKGESWIEGAKREVEEECNIKVSMQDKICSTWHSYSLNGKNILKKTAWFAMECVDDSEMKPQITEDIQAVEWKDTEQTKEVLFSTYPSIRYVINRYLMNEAGPSQYDIVSEEDTEEN
jgi:8-oxo-dGTP pyrophosphatase MutT (NUDIX family)